MPRKATSHDGYREEVLNIKLAELLSRAGILSVPETIIKGQSDRRLPDVIIGQYWGVRVVLEGKIGDSPIVRQQLEKFCSKRIEEGIAAICIGVIYPTELRSADWSSLEDEMKKSKLVLKVFTESGSDTWTASNLDGLSAVLRRAYESLVSENVVNAAVKELRAAIESVATDFANSKGTEARLQQILVLPRGEDD